MAQQQGPMAPPLSQLRIATFAAEDMNTSNIMEYYALPQAGSQLRIAAWAAEDMNTFNIMDRGCTSFGPALTIENLYKDIRKKRPTHNIELPKAKKKYAQCRQLDTDELAEEIGNPDQWVEPLDNLTIPKKYFIKLKENKGIKVVIMEPYVVNILPGGETILERLSEGVPRTYRLRPLPEKTNQADSSVWLCAGPTTN